jgi:hypothetical protein
LVCFFFAARCFMGKAAPRKVAVAAAFSLRRDRRAVFSPDASRGDSEASAKPLRVSLILDGFLMFDRRKCATGCTYDGISNLVDRVWREFAA